LRDETARLRRHPQAKNLDQESQTIKIAVTGKETRRRATDIKNNVTVSESSGGAAGKGDAED
jgi:hypothetical protein